MNNREAPRVPTVRGKGMLKLGLAVLIVGVLGLVGGVVMLNQSVLNKVDKFQRVEFSAGHGQVTFAHKGDYVVYYESGALTSDTTQIPRIDVRLTSPSGQQIVADTPYGGKPGGSTRKSLRYDYHGHNGVALWQFSVPEAGTYQLELGANAVVDSDAVLAFGRSVAGLLLTGLLTLLTGLFAIVVGAILLIVGALRWRRSRRAVAAAAAAGHPVATARAGGSARRRGASGPGSPSG